MKLSVRSEKLSYGLDSHVELDDLNLDSMQDCIFLLNDVRIMVNIVKTLEDYEELKNKEKSKKSEESKDSV